MDITEVRIKLMDDPSERLRAFCSVTFDNSFVVRDLKIIEGASGPFVAMPSRKLTSHCNHCGSKNHLRAMYCNQCGKRIQHEPAPHEDGRAKLYADIAHPINSSCREMIQRRVVEAYHEELERATQPGYVSRYDDYDDDVDVESLSPPPPHTRHEAPPRQEATATRQEIAATRQENTAARQDSAARQESATRKEAGPRHENASRHESGPRPESSSRTDGGKPPGKSENGASGQRTSNQAPQSSGGFGAGIF